MRTDIQPPILLDLAHWEIVDAWPISLPKLVEYKFCPNVSGTTYDKWKKRLYSKRCKLRTCPYCGIIQAHRILIQLKHEGAFMWSVIPHDKWGAWRKRMGRANMRYLGFPLSIGCAVLVVEGTYNLPPGDPGRVDLIATWLHNCVSGKRIRPSRGWGGKFSGSRPRSQPGRYINSPKDIGTILYELEYMAEARREKDAKLIEEVNNPLADGKVRVTSISEEDMEKIMSQ